MYQDSLDMPSASLREFGRIWDKLGTEGKLDVESLGEMINRVNMNELVHDALV